MPTRKTPPRLLYHRHFMLTEHLADTLRNAPEDTGQAWLDSYAEHLCRKHDAVRVKLTGHVHSLPSREAVQNGMKLTDPATYQSETLKVFECKVH